MRTVALVGWLIACSHHDATIAVDAPVIDDAAVIAPDAASSCEVEGAPGECVTVDACAALGDHTSYAGQCPGSAAIQCCIQTPSVADNPPPPPGYQLMAQAEVTPAMTTWAVAILNDPVDYP